MRNASAARRAALFGGAIAAALGLVLLAPCVVRGEIPARGDLTSFFWPMKAYTATRWAGGGGVPFWNPLSGCGEPWLAQLQTGVFYPLDLPFRLGGNAGILLAILLHVALAGSGMAAWLADLGTSRLAAALGAAAFAGGGAFLSLVLVYNNFCTAAFLPWLFLGARRAARGGPPALFGAAVALAFLGGEPALAAAGTLAAGALAWGLRGEEPADAAAPRGRSAARIVLGAALGVGLAAAALLPFADLLRDTGRLTGATKAEALDRPVKPGDLVDLVLPPAAAVTRTPSPGRGGYLATLAFSPLALVLAGFSGAGFAARPRLLAALAALGALGLLLALGASGGVMPLLWESGIARGLRFPARWFVFTHLALAALAAAGLDGVLHGRLLTWPRGVEADAIPEGRRAGLWSGALALLALGGLLWTGAAADRVAGVPAAVGLAALAAALAVLAAFRLTGRPGARTAGGLALALVAAPLPLGSADLFAGAPAGELLRSPRVLADVPPGGPGRIFTYASDSVLLGAATVPPGGAWTPDVARRQHEIVAGYANLPASVPSATSPSPISNPRRTRFFGAALSGGDAATILSLADVRRIVAPFPSAIRGAELESRAGPVLRYRLPGAAGRVFFARDAREAPDDAVFRALAAPGFDSESLVFVAPPAGPLPPPRPAPAYAVARVTRDLPESLGLETSSSGAGVVVVTRSWDPGFVARIDGALAPILRADLAFLALVVPAGEHRLDLEYRPRSFRIGQGVSAASALVLVALLLAGTRVRRR